MKQCKYCNTVNDDLYSVCIRCGKSFDEKIPKSINDNQSNISFFPFSMNSSPILWKIKIKNDILKLKQEINKKTDAIKGKFSSDNICPNCNKENPSSSKFCSNCGCSLQNIEKNIYFNSYNRENDNITTTNKQKRKRFNIKSFIAICVSLVLIIVLFNMLSTVGLTKEEKIAIRDIKTLQECLIDPDSLIIYNCYVNAEFSDDKKEVTFISFGSRNRMGGITTDEVCICYNDVEFKSEFDKAASESEYYNKYSDDKELRQKANSKVLSYEMYISVAFQVTAFPEKYTKIDIDKIEKKI